METYKRTLIELRGTATYIMDLNILTKPPSNAKTRK